MLLQLIALDRTVSKTSNIFLYDKNVQSHSEKCFNAFDGLLFLFNFNNFPKRKLFFEAPLTGKTVS